MPSPNPIIIHEAWVAVKSQIAGVLPEVLSGRSIFLRSNQSNRMNWANMIENGLTTGYKPPYVLGHTMRVRAIDDGPADSQVFRMPIQLSYVINPGDAFTLATAAAVAATTVEVASTSWMQVGMALLEKQNNVPALVTAVVDGTHVTVDTAWTYSNGTRIEPLGSQEYVEFKCELIRNALTRYGGTAFQIVDAPTWDCSDESPANMALYRTNTDLYAGTLEAELQVGAYMGPL